MKTNILKTFEDFLKEPLHILKKTIINITGIEADFVKESSITVETVDNTVQINVINSKNAYKLLSTVMQKKSSEKLRQLINENKTSEISKKFPLTAIGPKV